MYRVTPTNIRNNAALATIQMRRRGQPKRYQRLGDTYEVIYKVKCTKEWRDVTLRFLKKKPTDPMPVPGLSTPVWVRCTCPWFLYHCEYALSKYGSTWVHYSNGNPANQTNPQNTPFVCKHIYSLQQEIKKFDTSTAPFRTPKKTTLPKDTLKNLLDVNAPKNLPTEPELTPKQQRVKDEAIEELQQVVDQTRKQEAPKSVLDRVTRSIEEVVDRIDKSPEPISESVKKELDKVVTDIKDKGTKALTDNRIVRKLNDLIRTFRGF
jgi:hypothetical protein